MPTLLDMREGETLAAYVARKNAALIENRVRQGWLAAAHPALMVALYAWGNIPAGTAESESAWQDLQRYLVANLRDEPL